MSIQTGLTKDANDKADRIRKVTALISHYHLDMKGNAYLIRYLRGRIRHHGSDKSRVLRRNRIGLDLFGQLFEGLDDRNRMRVQIEILRQELASLNKELENG